MYVLSLALGLAVNPCEGKLEDDKVESFYNDYWNVADEEAVEGFKLLSEAEGIIPALEAAHAIAYVRELAPTMDRDATIVICLSGRGDKDVYTITKVLGDST